MNRGLFGALVLLAIIALVLVMNGGCTKCSRSGERAERANQQIKFINTLDDTIMVCIENYGQPDCGLLIALKPYQSRSFKRFQNGMDLLKLKYFTGMVPLDLYYVKEVNIITDSMRTPRK
jgi:hypothetical protein